MTTRRACAAVRPLVRAALLAAAASAGVPAWACGFHDQAQLARGAMNWVYPESLHVGTAVWMAQREGRLARDDGPGERDDLGPEARKRLGYLRVASLLGRLRVSLAAARGDGGRPDLAVVLLGPMLWSRYAVGGDDVRLAVHADGPAAGDVVVVTEASVVEALVTARLAARDAVRLGLVRLYGSPADAGAALDWLAAIR